MKSYSINASNGSVVPIESKTGEWQKSGEVDYEMSTLRYEKEEALEQIAVLEAEVKEKDKEIIDNRATLIKQLRLGGERITTLTAENQRLTKALGKIRERCRQGEDYAPVNIEIGMIAQAALREGGVRCRNISPEN